MAQSAQAYYTTEAEWGGYQFTPLSEIIDSIMLEIEGDPDHFLKNKRRSLIIKYAKDAIKDLTFDMANDVLMLELEIGDDLQFILPQDYVDWVGVFKVGQDGTLYPLDINKQSNRAITFLQDHNFNILYDDQGDTLEADGYNIYNKPMKRRGYSSHTAQFQLDTSKLSKYGEFSIDKRKGVMSFDSSLARQPIAVYYISDGLQWQDIDESEITFHKYWEQPILNWIYWKAIERGRNIPANRILMAEKRYHGSKQKAFARTANLKITEISKAFRASNIWVKS